MIKHMDQHCRVRVPSALMSALFRVSRLHGAGSLSCLIRIALWDFVAKYDHETRSDKLFAKLAGLTARDAKAEATA